MAREAVAIIAALGAAVSAGALGFAVLWGVDMWEPEPAPAPPVVAAPTPSAPRPAEPPAAPAATSPVQPSPSIVAVAPPVESPPIVVAPPGKADDARPARSVPRHDIAKAPLPAPLPADPPAGAATALPAAEPPPIVVAPPAKADDARPARSAPGHDMAKAPPPAPSASEPQPSRPESDPSPVTQRAPEKGPAVAATPPIQPPRPIVFAPPARAEDARAARAAPGHGIAAEGIAGRPIGELHSSEPELLLQITRVVPERAPAQVEPPVVALPDVNPLITVLPPTEHGHANIGAPKIVSIPPGSEGTRPPAPAAPPHVLTKVDPQPTSAPARADPRPVPGEPAPKARPRERAARPESIVVVRGTPPPRVMPDVVHPGPLIIKLPAPVRR